MVSIYDYSNIGSSLVVYIVHKGIISYVLCGYEIQMNMYSVLRDHSVFSSPSQRPMTSDFEGFSIPDFIHYIYFTILILEKEPVFSFLNVQC